MRLVKRGKKIALVSADEHRVDCKSVTPSIVKRLELKVHYMDSGKMLRKGVTFQHAHEIALPLLMDKG